MNDYFDEQRRIEEEARELGERRERTKWEKAKEKGREALTVVGQRAAAEVVAWLKDLLEADLKALNEGRPVPDGLHLKQLRGTDLEAACKAAARAAVNGMTRPQKALAVNKRIGEAVEETVLLGHWAAVNERQAVEVRKLLSRTNNQKQRKIALRHFAIWRPFFEAPWATRRVLSIGAVFTRYLVRLGMFERCAGARLTRKRNEAHKIVLTAKADAWVTDLARSVIANGNVQWPMVASPLPWKAPSGGGFRDREELDHDSVPKSRRPLPLVRRARREHKALLKTADLQVVYAGINAAQATAWRINPKVYAVMLKLMEAGEGGPGLTSLDPTPRPERPAEADFDATVRRVWNREARKVHEQNHAMISKRFTQHRIFSTARKFTEYPSIYFAYNLDFRGRVYACSDDLSPQGNDLQRGLLEFASGDLMSPEGMEWLLVHAANTYGVDKVSFGERINWAHENAKMIRAIASDPLDCIEWHKADQPWQFLGACFAIAEQAESPGAVCRVPVMLDGSCSGIQHYAALMRDAETGAAVNLVPSPAPRDLYANVAEAVMRSLAGSREPFAAEWYAWKIDRKITKRSVMVLPYGGTFLSNLEYVRDSVRQRFEEEGTPSWLTPENEKAALIALAKHVWQAMQEVVKGPIEGMNWVRRIVKAWAKRAPTAKLRWLSPCGFPVLCDYPMMEAKHLKADEGVTLKFHVPTAGIDWDKTERRAPPNFVHSLDASHLLLTLARAASEGIRQLAVVHDAFGTTPTQTAAFAKILREEFAKMYETSPVVILTDELAAMEAEQPEPAEFGLLQPDVIASSDYLFA